MSSHKFEIEFLQNNKYGYPEFDMIQNGSFKVAATNYADLFKSIMSSKEKYLDWVQEWRKAYKQLSLEIRHAKKNRKQTFTDKTFDQNNWISRSHHGRNIATRMMVMRMAAKEISKNIRKELVKEVA